MKLCLHLFLFIATSLLVNVNAQTLDKTLIGEDPTKLAQQARKNGNVVRGAILFHQGNINCVKCHRPTAEKDRIGPDLSRMDREVTDELIVESILQPSKTIKKGFETVMALTVDGRLLNGIVIKEDAETVVLHDGANPDRLITIRRDDLDDIRPSTKSSMPDELVNQLKDRQQFLDLLRYVIDIRERGPSAEVAATHTVARRQLVPELAGLVLIQNMNCVACHQSDAARSYVNAKKSPNLKWSSKWLNPGHMVRFIADPHGVKPGTSMPNMLEHLDDATRKESAEAITHYLVATVGNQFEFRPTEVDAARRGAELFHSVGCVACHSPRDPTAREEPLDDSLPMGDLSQKYSVDGLVEFLENPHVVRPSGRMPNMQLKHIEAQDLANYLLQKSDVPPVRWQVNSALVQKGKLLFSELNCAACHTDLENREPRPPVPLTLDRIRPDRGCLSDNSDSSPNFHLDENDKTFIRAALNRFPAELTNQQQIEISLESFNCVACHDRSDFGGVTELRNPHFQTTNMNLGEQGRIPPTLTGVGAKLKSKWMRDVLVNGRTIRPYMKTRMPQYGEENVGYLVELFQKADRLSETKFATFDDQKEMRKTGLEMAGNKGLNCVACHTYQYKLSDTMPAVDLTEMTERLKKDWFHQYMLAPQKFSPNTVMPSFWPGGVAIRKDIAGDPAFQVEALWQYLIDGRQARAPSGVVREPLEIVVGEEAEILRRNYQGIGKRGIGVGYPGGVNLAFDAEQMRLAMIWKGKFVDPAGAWTGQGSGTVRSLGRAIDFAKGPDLDDAANPWVVDDGRPPNHQFKGYVLDALRRPTFKYRFEDVEVRDFFSQVMDDATQQTHLRRSVKLSAADGHKDLSFRVVSAKDISNEGNGVFAIGNQLKVRLASVHPTQIVDVPDGKQLRVLLDLAAGEGQQLMLEYSWE